ncbi:MAG: S8 family serine peptidase [Candidatus Moraniibacteriota bacterium]
MEKFPHENKIEKKEKPEVLYLAAQTPNISELVPRQGNYRDENEGAVIFSTPDKALASAFLVEGHGDHWMKIGFYGDIPYVVIKSDREEFIKKDKGGFMYTVSSDTFDFDPNKGMGEREWVSKVSVKPLSEKHFESALDAMIENGVQVYFVDENIFEAINNSSNHGYGILIGLTSENEKRDVNIRNLRELNWSKESIEDARGRNLSKRDFSDTPISTIRMMDFDTETIWPEKENLPQGFNPEKLLEESKNPGLGIRELHEQGITGQGVVVAIIDQRLDINHPEYKDSISDYFEYGETGKEEISMHGPSVASLLVGKDCGVAPGAKLVYKAVPAGRSFHLEAEALNDIIKKNKTISQSEKVRVVSCSIGYMVENPEPGLDEWIEALKKAKEAGIFVVDVGGDQMGIPFGVVEIQRIKIILKIICHGYIKIMEMKNWINLFPKEILMR